MKLRKLEIRNIASIEDAVIDFEASPLAESNVILITGETGSGKSTILDAICLALYATTPRMNNTEMDGKWQENDVDEMDITDTMQLMRKNTTEAYARLSFLGSDGNEYVAEWSVFRKTKKLTRTWSLKNLTRPEASPQEGNGKGGAKDNEIKQAIQDAVGLTFDQFCRTTMLAQGEFTRFLKSSNKEKAAILEKITNTEQYAQIGAKVFELTHRKYEQEMKEVDPSEKEKELLPPERRKELESRIKEIEEEQNLRSAQRDAEQKKENWLSTDNNYRRKKTEAETKLNESLAAKQKEEFKTKLQNVQDWDSTEDARNSLTAINEANKTIQRANQTIQQLQSQYVMLLNGREFMRQKKDAIAEQIREIDAKIKAEGEQSVSLEDLNKQKDAAWILLGNIDTAKAHVKNYFDKKKNRIAEQSRLDGLKKKIEEQSKQYEGLKPQVEAANSKFKEWEAQYERLNLAVGTLAQKLRENLKLGKRCPICGQQVQSLDAIPHEQELRNIVQEAQRKRDEAKKNYEDLNGQQNACAIWLNQNVPSYNKDLKAFNEDKSLDEAKKEALNSLGKCNIKQLDEHSKEALEQAEINASKQKTTIDKKIARAKNREKLQQNLDNLEVEKYNIGSSLKQICESVPGWKTLTHSKAEELTDILARVQALSTKITTALANKNTATEDLTNNRTHLDSFLKENPAISEQRLTDLLKLKNEIGSQRQFVDDTNKKITAAQSAWDTINVQIEEHQKTKPEFAEGETIESLNKSIEECNKKFTDLGEESGDIKRQLKVDDDRIQEVADLKKEHEKRQLVFEQWKKLDGLIGDAKGDKFRLIAQSYILANLVNAANVHMRTLTDRYTLHAVPGQELIILVEDAYQGGVKRPASTISGGESFLVSLALALALSEIGQSLKVETLFIDEGFGTLSGDPLAKAIDTLGSLHETNNRQVCAISHREEVKDKIPVQLQVNQNKQSSSSTIEVVLKI